MSTTTSFALVDALGIAVRKARQRQRWSQEDLAAHAHLNRSYLGEIERGQTVISVVTLAKVACALEVSPSGLVAAAEAEIRHFDIHCLRLSAFAV
jgi:XRE family transcriptional regulator, regulator of sulfur utilization